MLQSPVNRFNPNPVTKLIAVLLLGFTPVHTINDIFALGIVVLLSVFFLVNGYVGTAIKGGLIYAFLYKLPNFEGLYHFPVIIKIFISLLIMVRMFYLPFFAAKFLIKTSDVGSIITSMDKIKIPQSFSIPLAVMFRFFPSFKEEKKNIKRAMKIRGIKLTNPIKYLEYVAVPVLILSSNISDDIAKAAEVKCIENPIQKTRYTTISIGVVDFIFLGLITIITVGGWLW